MIDVSLQCTGQGCPERDECLRFLLSYNPYKTQWASFDIERQLLGTCAVKIVPQIRIKK